MINQRGDDQRARPATLAIPVRFTITNTIAKTTNTGISHSGSAPSSTPMVVATPFTSLALEEGRGHVPQDRGESSKSTERDSPDG